MYTTDLHSTIRGARRTFGPLLGLAALAGCGKTSVNAPLPPAQLSAIAAAALHGAAGEALPEPIQVRVLAGDGHPLPGTTVTFSAGQGGSADPGAAITDGEGVARTRWTLGTTAGSSTLTASAGGVSTSITATVVAGKPATVARVTGDNQTAAAGTAVPIAPSVRVADAFGNLVSGAPVSFSVLSGGGRVTDGLRPTNAQGVAAVGSWVLGPGAGVHSLAARVEESGVANNPILFTAIASARTGSRMLATAGNNQRATAGRLVPIAPTVVVSDAAGDGVPGVVVTFAVASGGGSVVGGRQVTDASGTAAVGGWFLGDAPGPNTLTASAPGLTAVTFTATAEAGRPVSMTAVSPATQSAEVGTAVQSPPSVILRDASGLPVQGVAVTFAVTAGAGTVVGSPATTNSSGVATLTSWTLGTTAGTNTVVASSTGVADVTFTATGTAGAATAVATFAGDNQVAVQGTQVPVPPTVRVRDANGNPVAGVVVAFAVTGGGGSVTGANQITDVLGLAAVGGWTLGAGTPNRLTATVSGTNIAGSPVTFVAQSATQIVIVSAPAGPVPLGSSFTISVQLLSSAGAPVALAGVPLTIGIASGGGTLNGTLARFTAANGVATFSSINVTGPAGARTFTITGLGLAPATTGSITFN